MLMFSFVIFVASWVLANEIIKKYAERNAWEVNL